MPQFTADEVDKYRDIALKQERANTLGFVFGDVPVSIAHADYCNMTKEQKQTLFDKLRPDSSERERVTDLKKKWSLVQTQAGASPVEVIEDTGSDDNWISPVQLQALGLQSLKTDPVEHKLINGATFVTTQCAQLPLHAKGNRQIHEIFYVAPKETPIQMLVGRSFMNKHPDAFWDEIPSER